MKCICGKEEWSELQEIKGLQVRKCLNCKVFRQETYTSLVEAEKYYLIEYVNEHTYKQDYKVAEERLKIYDLVKGSKLLDIGCGNGAFIDACREKGINAFGIDIKSVHPYCYQMSFEESCFPSDEFDVVTMHDVLEHVVNPIQVLKEVRRILKEGGKLIIDFPLFFDRGGERHWRPKQHAWLLDLSQLVNLVTSNGYRIHSIYKPVEGKITLILINQVKVYSRVCLLPGIGDIYWTLTRLPELMQQYNLTFPVDVSILKVKEERDNRSIPFLKMFPFLSVRNIQFVTDDKIFERLYWGEDEVIEKEGTLYIGCNGILRKGKKLETKGKTNWYPKSFLSLDVLKRVEEKEKQYGKYIIIYLTEDGMFRDWMLKFPLERIEKVLNEMRKQCTLVWVGKEWDKDSEFYRIAEQDINLIGKTSFEELTALILGSQMVFGYCSGLTFFSVYLKKPTYILWSHYFENSSFFSNALPPDSLNNWYIYDVVDGLDEQYVINRWKEFWKKNCSEEKIKPKISVVTVLKSGGEYKVQHVIQLYKNVKKYLKIPFEFICLSDVEIKVEGIRRVPLIHNYKGWWSKIEVFRKGITNTMVTLYLDIDTVLVKEINEVPFSSYPLMLRDLGGDGLETGIMLFLSDQLVEVYKRFEFGSERKDAQYIERVLNELGYAYKYIQDTFSGIYSYKYHCKESLPKDAKIICFHGHPRPWEVNEEWIERE